MEKQSTIIAAALLSIGLLGAGLFLKAGVESISEADRQVTVRGLSEREVPANLVKWPISFMLTGSDLQGLNQTMLRQTEQVVQFLKDNGLTDEDYTINPPSVYDRNANRWNNETNRERYEITASITVKSQKVDTVRAAIAKTGDLITKGIVLSQGDEYSDRGHVSYEFTQFQDMKLEMTRQSIANARAAADEFALNSGSTIGQLISASQGSLSIEDSDETTPYIKKLRVVSTMTYKLK